MKSCATCSSSLISRLYCVRRSILLSTDRPPLAGPRPTQRYTLSCWPLTIKYCGVVYSLHTSKKYQFISLAHYFLAQRRVSALLSVIFKVLFPWAGI